MKKHTSVILSPRTLIVMAFLLIGVLVVSMMVHEWRRMERTDTLYRAYTSDTAKQRLGSIAQNINDYTLSGLGGVIALGTSVIETADIAGIAERLERFVALNDQFYFARYVSPEGETVRAGDAAFDTDGQDDPFPELAAVSEQEGRGGLVVSSLFEQRQITGDSLWVIYAYVPLVVENQFRGALELGFAVDPLFAEVQRSERDTETLVLLDASGRYLVPPEHEPPLSESFFEEYPHEVTGKVYGDQKSGAFTHEGMVYVFRHIMAPGVRSGVSDRNHWVLLSISSEQSVFSASERLRVEYMGAIVTFLILFGMLSVVLGILSRSFFRHHASRTH